MKQAIAICFEWVLIAGAIMAAVLVSGMCSGAEQGGGFTGFIEYGSDTCPPCRELWPKLKQLEGEGYAIRWFDAAADRCTAEQQGAKLWPTTILYKGGRKVWQAVGVWPIETYRNAAAAEGIVPQHPTRPAVETTPQPAVLPMNPATTEPPVVPVDPASPAQGCGCGCTTGNCKCCQCDVAGINRTLNLHADRTTALERVAGDNTKLLGHLQSDLAAVLKNHSSGSLAGVAKKTDDAAAALGWLATLSPWLLGALGVSTGGAGTFAALALRGGWRLLMRRRAINSATTHSYDYVKERIVPDPVVVTKTVQGADVHHLHTAERYRNTYTEVDNGKTDRAWAEACRIVAEHYPGKKDTVAMVERVMKQLLAGEPVT